MPEVNEEKLTQTALTVVERASLVKIMDQESYNFAAELLTTVIKPTRKAWTEYWDQVKKPLREAVNAVQAKFKNGDDKLASAESSVKMAIYAWDTEQDRIKQKLQAEADRKMREAAEAERAALAVELEGSGMTDEDIEAAVASVPEVVAAPVQETYAKASGISLRDNWKARVTSVKDLCKHIGAGKLKFDPKDEVKIAEFFETLLDKRAKADKSTLVIPGVKAYNEPVVAGRTR